MQEFLVGSLQLSYIARHLALTGSELFDGLPHVNEIPCYLLDLLHVQRRGGRGDRRSRGRSSLRNGRGLRRVRCPA
jgi:hypothetical protein